MKRPVETGGIQPSDHAAANDFLSAVVVALAAWSQEPGFR